MRELLHVTDALQGAGLSESVALSADKRFSGAPRGFCIAHIMPEAVLRGPPAAIRTGDVIHIDVKRRGLDLEISTAAMKKRLAKRKVPEPHDTSSAFHKYAITS